jgi:uncharacterized protein YaaQ
MTLDEAYGVLGLQPALDFEQTQLAKSGGVLRQVGTTTRMAVMAALDLVDGTPILLRSFDWISMNQLRQQVLRYASRLGGDAEIVFDLVNVRLTPATLSNTDGRRVYTDHMRDALDVDDRRVLGPLGWAHSVRGTSPIFEVVDRDGVTIAHVTEKGCATLRQRHFTDVSG